MNPFLGTGTFAWVDPSSGTGIRFETYTTGSTLAAIIILNCTFTIITITIISGYIDTYGRNFYWIVYLIV